MKKINYCKICGEKVINGEYCPICGAKLNNNQEVKQMQKQKRTRKILLVILAIVLIGGLLIIGGAYTNNNKTFVKQNFSESCSVELPTWIKFNEGAGDINSNANIGGSSVSTTTKALFGNNQVMQITYGKSTVDGSAVGADLNNRMNMNMGNIKIYTRTVMSSETGEFVTVTGENETLVNYIADHTLFNGKHGVNNTKNTNDTTSNNQQTGPNNNNQQKVLAYKSDGTPMYDGREVDDYMTRKYNDNVQYHIQDNGYISHDGYKRSSKTPVSDPIPSST